MKSIILKISAFAFAYLSSLNVISQNVNIDYEAWNPTNPPCNVFGTGTSVPATIGGSTNTITHSSLYGQPNYSNSDKALELQTNYVNGSDTRGTTFRIAYNFKVGYTYEINVNAAVSSTANNGTDPILLLKFSDNTGGTNPPCNGPANMSLNSNGSKSINATAFKDYNFQFLTQLTINYPTIEVTAFPYTNGGVRTDKKSKWRRKFDSYNFEFL